MHLTHPFVLASASPRRSHLLAQAGFEFSVHPSNVAEVYDSGDDPESVVSRLATAKADDIARQFPDSIVLAADTIVVLDDEILGKPDTPEDAICMLEKLSGRTHTVFTGFAIHLESRRMATVDVESTRVTMDNAPLELIERYVATGSPLDKAGSYGIQDMGAFLVSRIEGDFYTVMGLPLHRLYKRLTMSFNEYIVLRDYQYEKE
ncbi:MAG: septum formation protein Maf [Rhodothermales bacterium]|nr:septum formation protein Maf [Rhodothermales bacterium]